MALVSVIVPVYNVEKYIHRCVDSILAQSFTDFELILVDDGSPDNCGAICDAYAKKDSRIKVVHKENGGVSSARNIGLDIATGQYITFVDSDDSVAEMYLEELLQWREFDYVAAGYIWQDHQGDWQERRFCETEATVEEICNLPTQYLGRYYFGSPWATLLKLSLVKENGIRFNTSVHSGEDTLFIFSYLNYAKTVRLSPLCGYYYYYNPTSLVHTLQKDYWKWKIIVEQTILDFFGCAKGEDRVFLLNREFEVLMNLIFRYDLEKRADVLPEIYMHVFFERCIAYKKQSGGLREKLFIYCMERNQYLLYKRLDPYLAKISSWRQRVKKLLGNGG